MANSFYLDASALAKRYVPEKGSEHVDAILDTIPANRIHVLNVGAGEVMSILVRKRNAGTISTSGFAQAVVDFETEIVHAAAVRKTSVSNRLALWSFPLIVAHSINSTDAITLKSALAIARKARAAINLARMDVGDPLLKADDRIVAGLRAEGREEAQSLVRLILLQFRECHRPRLAIRVESRQYVFDRPTRFPKVGFRAPSLRFGVRIVCLRRERL